MKSSGGVVDVEDMGQMMHKLTVRASRHLPVYIIHSVGQCYTERYFCPYLIF